MWPRSLPGEPGGDALLESLEAVCINIAATLEAAAHKGSLAAEVGSFPFDVRWG